MADQLSYKFVGYNALNRWIHTPGMNYMAKRSLVFNQAYCSSPLCIPSRQSIYTGRNTRHHQCICDYRILDRPTIFHHLAELGVKSYAAGKLDFRFDEDQHHGLTERPNAGIGAQDTIPGTNNFSSFIPEYMVTSLDRENDDQCCSITETSLDLLRRRETSLVVSSYVKPHESWDNGLWWDAPRRFWDIYNDRPVPDAARGYAANVSLLDEHLGYLLWTAGEEGLLENTLVIFASDHGELAGSHGRWGKQCMHEEAIKVPFMLWHKGIVPRQCNEVVGLIDIFPTVFEWLGLPCPPCDGASLLSPRHEDHHVFIEVFWGKYVEDRYCDFDHVPLTYSESTANLMRCIRRGRWKYVDDGASRELFHVTHGDCRKMTQKSPSLVDRYQKEMDALYPIEGILSKYHFERQLNEKAFG